MTNVHQLVGSAKERFASFNRRRKVDFALRAIREHSLRSVLFIGVKADNAYVLDNAVERAIAAEVPHHVASGLGHSTPDVFRSYVAADGRALPFADRSFDLVFANAVVEHVGLESDQRRFMLELARVGRFWIATTPNRAFPVESHTNQLLVHWRRGWSLPDVPRLLTKHDFAGVVPEGGRVLGFVGAPTLTATNLTGHGPRTDDLLGRSAHVT